MEITAKQLNKMKQKNKQPFPTLISGLEKKMLEIYENGGEKKGFLAIIRKNKKMLSLWYCWPQNE